MIQFGYDYVCSLKYCVDLKKWFVEFVFGVRGAKRNCEPLVILLGKNEIVRCVAEMKSLPRSLLCGKAVWRGGKGADLSLDEFLCVCVLSSVLTVLGSWPFRLIQGCHIGSRIDCVAGRQVELPDMMCLFQSWPPSRNTMYKYWYCLLKCCGQLSVIICSLLCLLWLMCAFLTCARSLANLPVLLLGRRNLLAVPHQSARWRNQDLIPTTKFGRNAVRRAVLCTLACTSGYQPVGRALLLRLPRSFE
jgi:hypothetical protein